jgi:hypothetical protein
MLGAIAGDIIGSVYEHHPIKTKEFPLFHPHCRFTDDSVLTIAIAKTINFGMVIPNIIVNAATPRPEIKFDNNGDADGKDIRSCGDGPRGPGFDVFF